MANVSGTSTSGMPRLRSGAGQYRPVRYEVSAAGEHRKADRAEQMALLLH